MENHHAINGKIHYFYGPFSIANCYVHQRVADLGISEMKLTSMNQVHTPNHSAPDVIPTVIWPFMKVKNWLLQWDKKTCYKWGDFLVLITGITRAITAVQWLS